MPKEFDGFLYVLVGIYLGYVVFNKNSLKLLDALSKEGKFVKWGLSVAILYWLWKSKSAGSIVAALAGMGLLSAAMLLLQRDDIANLIKDF